MKAWRTLFRRPLLSMGVAALLVAAAVAGAIGVGLNPLPSSAGAAPSDTAAPVPPPSAPAVGSVSPSVRSHLGVFRRGRRAGDTLPPRVDRMMRAFIGRAGPNAALARQALVTPGGTSVYLMPSQDGLCLVDSTGSQEFCAPDSAVLSGDATASTDCSPTLPSDVVEISGVVPDGSSNVTLGLSDGTSVPLDVQGNAYLARFKRGDPLPRSISWDSPAGPGTAATAVPSDAATLDCVTPPGGQSGTASP